MLLFLYELSNFIFSVLDFLLDCFSSILVLTVRSLNSNGIISGFFGVFTFYLFLIISLTLFILLLTFDRIF